MFELVIPCAGKGSRFPDKTVPKPLIQILNQPSGLRQTMLEWSLSCLPLELVRKMHFVTNEENNDSIESFVRSKWGNFMDLNFVVDRNPKGQAASAILGLDACNGPVIMANCDQWVKPAVSQMPIGNSSNPVRFDWSPLYEVLTGMVSVLVPTFAGYGSKWSYAVEDSEGRVACLIEKPYKPPESGKAIAGIFAYHSSDSAKFAIERMMEHEFRVRGEYYTAPSINYMVRDAYPVRTMSCIMHGIGTPEDVDGFLTTNLTV